MEVLCTLRRRDEQHGHLTRLEDRQIQVNLPMSGHNDVERWGFLPQADPQLLVHIGEWWIDVLGRPAVLGYRPQGSRSNNHSIGHGSQQAHDHLIVLIEPTDVSSARMARLVQRHDPIERGDEVANDVRMAWMWRERETTIEGREVRWQRQSTATFHIEE